LSLIPDILQYLFLVDVNSTLGQFRLARVARTARLATRMARLPKILALLNCGKSMFSLSLSLLVSSSLFINNLILEKEEVEGVEPSAIAQQLQQKISAKVRICILFYFYFIY